MQKREQFLFHICITLGVGNLVFCIMASAVVDILAPGTCHVPLFADWHYSIYFHYLHTSESLRRAVSQ